MLVTHFNSVSAPVKATLKMGGVADPCLSELLGRRLCPGTMLLHIVYSHEGRTRCTLSLWLSPKKNAECRSANVL